MVSKKSKCPQSPVAGQGTTSVPVHVTIIKASDHGYKTLAASNKRMITASYKALSIKVHRMTMCGLTKDITVTMSFMDGEHENDMPR